MDKKTILGLVATAILIVGAMVYLPFLAGPVGAQDADPTLDNELRGWAWSGSTGWVSFNTADYSATDVDYKVVVDQNGNLTGYAWSLNLGWIKFEPGPSFAPSGCSTNDCYGAKLDGNNLKGWARVCSVYQGDCTGTLRSAAELGGWDGWIQMRNVTRQANGAFHGYAWGDLNLAWLDFGFNDDGDNNDVCDPLEEVCGGDEDTCAGLTGDALTCCREPGNPICPGTGNNQVTVNVDTWGCTGSEVSFSPPGEECGDNCFTYDANEDVEITFTGDIPDEVEGCPEGGYTTTNLEGVCLIDSIDTNYDLVAYCNTGDISSCKPKFTGGVPLILSEDSSTEYPALSNSGVGKLHLQNEQGVDCNGLSYRLESEAYKLIGGEKQAIPDPEVSLACMELGDPEYNISNCDELNGGAEVKVKAYFETRPEDRAAKWSLEMTAISGEEESQTFNTLNQLIQYFARTSSK